MHFGVFISVASHIVLVALALFGAPKLFDTPSIASIEVDLVRPEEVERPPEKAPEKPKDQKPDWLPEQSAAPQQTARQQETAKPPQATKQQEKPKPPEAQQPQQSPPQQQAEAEPQTPTPPPDQQPQQPSIFDPANIPALMNLPTAPDKNFDAEAMTQANLADEDRAALKARIKTCWKLPPGVSASQAARVVVRISLRRDGSLAADPLLIEAPASRDGPVILQTAMRALKDCQPYAFLPADKYREWRLLDLSFSPRDMAGG